MIRLAGLLVFCASCASLNSFRYSGSGTEPILMERVTNEVYLVQAESWDSKVQKLITVNNPLDKEVEVTVGCSSILQGDVEFSIPAHSSQVAFIVSSKMKQYTQTCKITNWSVK